MPRTPLPLHAGDISALARSLRGQLALCDRTPGHVELLNMLARGAGFRNFQHLRAQAEIAAPARRPAPVLADPTLVRRAARYFDATGRLMRWPGKFSHRGPCLWVIWARLPAGQDLTEPEVNRLIAANHLFEDNALLRREMCDRGLLDRTTDGRRYRRVERRPTPEALELIRLMNPK